MDRLLLKIVLMALGLFYEMSVFIFIIVIPRQVTLPGLIIYYIIPILIVADIVYGYIKRKKEVIKYE